LVIVFFPGYNIPTGGPAPRLTIPRRGKVFVVVLLDDDHRPTFIGRSDADYRRVALHDLLQSAQRIPSTDAVEVERMCFREDEVCGVELPAHRSEPAANRAGLLVIAGAVDSERKIGTSISKTGSAGE
jgi:hypothetical protein